MASFRNELRSSKGFDTEAVLQAADFAAAHNQFEDADVWSEYALNGIGVGQKNFRTLSTRAMILQKKGDLKGADLLMKEAMPLATMLELHQYGRQLLDQKRSAEALQVFRMNASKNPGEFTTYVGLARGFSANGDFKNALKNAMLALPLSPDKINKEAIEMMITDLKKKS